eukprot:jgi/Ulvmu1/3705/UM170_0011.1
MPGGSLVSVSGRPGSIERIAADMDPVSAPGVFLCSASNVLDSLRELTVEFGICEHLHYAPGMARLLAALTQLASL